MSEISKAIPRLDREDVSIGLFGLFFLGLFIGLRQIANEFPSRAGQFPELVLTIGIILASGMLFKRFVLNTVFPGMITESEGGVDEYLSGGESSLSVGERIVRLSLLSFWIAVFFVLGGLNLFLAISVSYGGMAISFGERDPKGIALSLVVMNLFIYIAFVRVLNVPIEVF